MTAILALKLFLVPLLIYAVTLAGRKWGPRIAGWLSAFPIVAGPILFTISLEQGARFAAAAAEGTLLAVFAVLVFGLGYAWASRRFGVLGAMSCALALYTLALVGLTYIHVSARVCFVMVNAALLLAPKLFPTVPFRPPNAATPPNDLPWRMLAAALLVLGVTFFASRLGPRVSGFLAMFPVMSTVLTGFSHHYSGRIFAVAQLRGMIFGYFSFATFCLMVSVLLRLQPVAVAFVLALVCAFAVQMAVKKFVRGGN